MIAFMLILLCVAAVSALRLNSWFCKWLPWYETCPQYDVVAAPVLADVPRFAVDAYGVELEGKSDASVCQVCAYMVRIEHTNPDGRVTAYVEVDGQAADGKHYLVHTVDVFSATSDLAGLAAVKELYPIGTETYCLPQVKSKPARLIPTQLEDRNKLLI